MNQKGGQEEEKEHQFNDVLSEPVNMYQVFSQAKNIEDNWIDAGTRVANMESFTFLGTRVGIGAVLAPISEEEAVIDNTTHVYSFLSALGQLKKAVHGAFPRDAPGTPEFQWCVHWYRKEEDPDIDLPTFIHVVAMFKETSDKLNVGAPLPVHGAEEVFDPVLIPVY